MENRSPIRVGESGIMNDTGKIYELYDNLLKAWNERDAEAFAKLFQGKGEIVGFDGSRVVGQKEIGQHLQDIFSKHQTPPYVGAPERLHSLKSGVLMLAAKAGMKTGDSGEFNSDLWSEQTLIAVKTKAGWRVSLFSNTPATLSGDAERRKNFVRDFKQALVDRKERENQLRKKKQTQS